MTEPEINFALPEISLNDIKLKYALTPDEEEIIMGIIYNPVNGKGVLRATRPKQSGIHSWVWRNVMLLASPEEKFHSIATVLDSYIDPYVTSNPDIELKLNQVVEKIISCMPQDQLPGSVNWKGALGVN